MPTTGTATYNTTIIGWLLRQNAIENLRGGLGLNVDFATGAITANVDTSIVVTDVNGQDIATDLAELTGVGSIGNGNFFSGQLTGVGDPNLSGDFQGAFFGPSAAEVGGTLNIISDDYAGSAAFVGPKN